MTRSDPVKQIRDLRRLLDLYREGFPILKELVQNAEDAQATCLDYGWSEGLFPAKHPLLKSPALFFINNGKFDERDARSLYYFDVSGKSDQEGTIGKFGLGLKSVFHFCEAFFYLAPPLPEGSKPNCNIFNPWEGSGCHDDWDKFEEKDQEIIKKHLKPLLDQTEYQSGQWFIIWIPLRQEYHKTEKDKDENGTPLGTIKSEFFDTNKVPDFLQKDQYFNQISSLLSNLHNLKFIRYWQDGNIQYQAKSSNDNDYSRLALKELEEELGKQKQFKGQFRVNKYDIQKINITINNHYFGNEIILNKQELIEILHHEKLKLENTEKIKAHCAVIFTHTRNCQNLGQKSFLTLRLATFLPVPITEDEKDEIKIDCSSEHSYNLTLHGYFFINYARTKIIGWEYSHLKVKEIEETDKEKSREQLETEWNFILYDYLLSQILETLSQFADQYGLPISEIEAICLSLKSSSLFHQNNLSAIHSQYKYMYRITSNGSKWELINIYKRVLTLPNIPDWDVFSKLAELSNQVYLTLKEKPNLCLKNKLDKWEKSEILEIISNLDYQKIFSQQQYINYLKELIQLSGFKGDNDVQRELGELVKKGLSRLDLENIENERRESLRSLISLIHKDKYFVVGCDQDILQSIYKLELEVLVIHKSFNPEQKQDQNSSQLDSANDAISIIECLSKILKERNNQAKQNEVYQLITTVLTNAKKHIQIVFKECCNLRIVKGENLKTSQKNFYSLSEIKGSNFFAKSGTNKLAESLQKVLATQEIILLDKKMVDIFKEQINIKDSDSCLNLLTKNTQLSEPQNRINLLKELLKFNLASKNQLRYLLHGKQKHFDDIDTPLYITSQGSSFWQKIAQQVLEQKQELWRLIDVGLASELSDNQKEYLGIESFEVQKVINLIKQLGVESVKGESLEPEERDQLLIEASNYNEIDLWKQLKLHQDVNGKLVDIGKNTYLNIPEIKIELPQQLQSRVTLIKQSKNPSQKALQNEYISKWTTKTAICFLLDQDQPHLYFKDILKLFKQLSSEKKLDQQLKQTKWLTDSTCQKAIAPQDVIYIKSEKLARHISTIVKLEENKYQISDLHNQLENENELTRLFSRWDANNVIDKILSCPNPHQYCWIILDTLDSLSPGKSEIKHDELLVETAWLITTENKPIAPQNVIYHDHLQKDIQYIFVQAQTERIKTQYIDFLMLDKQIKSKYPEVWKWLKNEIFINKIDNIIPKLKIIIKQLKNYQLGNFSYPNNLTIEDIDKWIETKIFEHIDDKILPCWSFLKKISSTQRQNLLPFLQSLPLASERLVAILNYLSEHFKGRAISF